MTTNNSTNNFSSSPLTTKGDLYGYDTANNRLPVGSNYYFVQADSSQAIGLSYQLPIPQDQLVSYSKIDFLTGSANGDGVITNTSNGTGASCAIVSSIDNLHFGILKMDMGTTTTGYAYSSAGATFIPIILGNSTVIIETCVYFNALSNGTDTYTYLFGQLDSTATASPANGVYIGYSSAINSGNWTITIRKASSSTTTNAASGPIAQTWYKLRLVITNNTSVTAYVGVAGSDLTSIGTVTASCPSVNLFLYYSLFIKSAGTTDTFGYTDYFSSKIVYDSPR